MKLQRKTSACKPGSFCERLIVREFKDREDAYAFLGKQDNNNWREYDGPLTKGTYAFAGGSWHNVKKLDPSILAHV